jgi:hypothetical protein
LGALTTYQTQVQRLLHDTSTNYWPLAELTDYINEARNRVAQDSKCLRQLVTGISLTAQTEYYVPQSFLGALGPRLINVMGITLYWGNQRVKLNYYPFTKFDALFRPYQTYYQRPVAFTRMGATLVWLGPSPDQAYVTDWDVAVIPNPLVTDATVEEMPIPFQEPVQYYAAFKAKWKEQAQGEAAIFMQQYSTMMRMCYRGFMPFVITNPYNVTA